MNKKKMRFGILIIFLAVALIAFQQFYFVSADSNVPAQTQLTQNICCQKTTSGLYCQNVPSSQCAPGAKQVPTSCDSTSFCSPGYCYDSTEGTCSDNTPQLVCNQNNGTWSATAPPQCNLGCCVLGDQAAFVTQTRCKKLSSDLGLQTNYNPSITNEQQCVLSVQNQVQGACVYNQDYQRTCLFTTRAECAGKFGAIVDSISNNSTTGAEFHANTLCSAESLGTNCGPTRQTMTVPGKDGIYFQDSCGNPGNIYDASKVNDKNYWSDVKTLSESCNPGSDNANNPVCGNCNYLLGSFARKATSGSARPTYGNYICADLNCANTENGNSYKNGESWCVYNDKGTQDQSDNSVGSEFYRHVCENGQEVVEPCASFRQETCLQSEVNTTQGDFSYAACVVNRWQDCTAQTNKKDCENTDQRDCSWMPGVELGGVNATEDGSCVPKVTPGLQFWSGSSAQSVCAQANAKCVVTFEKGLFGGKSCKGNCQCLSPDWKQQRIDLCESLGDCGPKINWVGDKGYNSGYNLSVK